MKEEKSEGLFMTGVMVILTLLFNLINPNDLLSLLMFTLILMFYSRRGALIYAVIMPAINAFVVHQLGLQTVAETISLVVGVSILLLLIRFKPTKIKWLIYAAYIGLAGYITFSLTFILMALFNHVNVLEYYQFGLSSIMQGTVSLILIVLILQGLYALGDWLKQRKRNKKGKGE